MTDTLVDVRSLYVHFRSQSSTVRAVDGVDFSVTRGETLCIVGESGSGKTITSLALLRLVPPPAKIIKGSINFEGTDILRLSEAQIEKIRGRRMAMIFQNPGSSLDPVYSVGAQLMEILRAHEQVGRGEAGSRIISLLREVGISDPEARLRQYPHELSGGMKQRICIARALLCNPALVLADEPTTALDVTIQAQILELLREMRRRYDMSMILVTHDMGVVAQMADRVAVMYAGRVCETGSVRTIFASPLHPYTRALLDSTPRIDRSYRRVRGQRLSAISGRPPDMARPPAGCRFHDRCPDRIADCARVTPVETTIAPGHTVSCIRQGSRAMEEQAA